MYNPPRRFSHQSNETINIGVSERRKITTKPKHIIPSAIGDKIQILKPISVAVSPHDGKMVIADQELGQLIFFDKKYKFVKTVGKPGHDEGEYHLIKAVSIGVNGDIVVADSGNNRIQVLSPGGDFVRAFGSGGKNVGQFDDITDIVVDSQNRIYVCDAGNSRVQILDLSGSFIREFGSCGSKIGDIVHPQSIAVCPSTGNVILADTGNRRVQVFYATGQHRFTIGLTGAEECELMEPTCVAIGPKWSIMVADPTQGRVCVFTMDGILVQEYGHSGMLDNGEQFEPRQLAINGDNGDVIVIDSLNKRVIVFSG